MSVIDVSPPARPTLGALAQPIELGSRRCIRLLQALDRLDRAVAARVGEDVLQLVVSCREAVEEVRHTIALLPGAGIGVPIADALRFVIGDADDRILAALELVCDQAPVWLERARAEVDEAHSDWTASCASLDLGLHTVVKRRFDHLAPLGRAVEHQYEVLCAASRRWARFRELVMNAAGEFVRVPNDEIDAAAWAGEMARLRTAFRAPSKSYRPASYHESYTHRVPRSSAVRAPLPRPPVPQPRKR